MVAVPVMWWWCCCCCGGGGGAGDEADEGRLGLALARLQQ